MHLGTSVPFFGLDGGAMTHEQMEFPWEIWETFARVMVRVQLPLTMPDARQEFNRPISEQQPLFENPAYLEP